MREVKLALHYCEIAIVYIKDCNLIIAVCYVPPNISQELLNEVLNKLIIEIDIILLTYITAQVVICGDFNRKNISILLISLDLVNIVKESTRGNYVLDLCLISKSRDLKWPATRGFDQQTNHKTRRPANMLAKPASNPINH